MEKSCRKCHQMLVPGPFSNLVNNPKQPLHARNSFKNKIFSKRIIKKPWKSQLSFLSIFYSTLFVVLNWKVWKGRKKVGKFEYLEKGMSFLDEVKNISHSF